MRYFGRVEAMLAALEDVPVNYDADALDPAHPPRGWNVDRRRQPLPGEPAGDPMPEGSWEIARRLIRGYEFADPSLVRAHYDHDRPLEGRPMLLELRAFNVLRVYVGTRVVHVYDEVRRQDGRDARVFGWAYRTLEGHVECGQMDWQVWKWTATGEVEFRVHAVSRTAHIPNPVVRVGFAVVKGHERTLFLDSTCRRMLTFTQLGLDREHRAERLREAASELTARHLPSQDDSHDKLARDVETPDPT